MNTDTSLPISRDPATGDVVDDDASSALVRLALTREELRQALTPRRRGAEPPPEGLGGVAADVAERVKALPGVDLVLGVIESWWARHPLRTVGLVAAEASRSYVTPIAQRRPLALVLGAMAGGALLVLLKPWRWLPRRVLFMGLVPALAVRLARELPIDSWLQMYRSISVPRGTAPREVSGRASPPMDVPSPTTVPPVAAPSAAEREPSTIYP